MPTHKSVREIINGLLIRSCVHCDEPVEAEKGLKEHNEMVDDCLAQLAELVRADMSGKCDTPLCEPEQLVTHDMAIDAGDPELEGTLFREVTFQRCGGCPSCIIDQALEHIAQKLEGKA